eukprot:1400929-Amphidinium_carterae.1
MQPTPAGLRNLKHAGPRMPTHAAAQPPLLRMGEDADMPDADASIPREGSRERPRVVGVGIRINARPPGASTPRMSSAAPVPPLPLSQSPRIVPTTLAGAQGLPRAKASVRPPP